MPVCALRRGPIFRVCLPAFTALLLAAFAAQCLAVSVHGLVTDPTGAKVTSATVALVSNGKVVATALSSADGSFQIQNNAAGRFFLVVAAKSFRQLQTPDFYAGPQDSLERNLVVEPQWVHESIVVTATGTPTPQAQTSAAASVLGALELAQQQDLVSVLRLMPGTFVVQTGQLGAQTSLFMRGGDSDDTKILLDGVDAGDMGNQFSFGPLSTTAFESVEVNRGPNSNLYGAGAETGVVSLTTPHGTTSFPSLLFQGDAGNFNTAREELEAAGTHGKLDYLGAFSWLQTGNALPMDEYHVATSAANLGWQPNAATQIRGTLHYGVDATGVPNAWDFYHVTDDATQKDQDLFLSASADNQTTPAFQNSLRYGATRKREQYNQWAQEGIPDSNGDSLGYTVTIAGANGASVTGQALLDFGGPLFSSQYVNNRDQLVYQGDYRFSPHLIALAGFHYEDERGVEKEPSYGTHLVEERTNYDYLASIHGDFKNRFFYTLGGSLEHYSEFGVQTSPRAGLSYYALRPRKGIFSSTRILFNYGDAVREPKLTDQTSSLYTFLLNKQPKAIAQLNIGALAAPETRTYEGGVEQLFFGERLSFTASYFHNQFGKEIESVSSELLAQLIPGLTVAELGAYNSYYVNTEAFRAQGIEAMVSSGIGRSIFLRGGYTYLDGVVQRSFSSDNEALMDGYAPTYNGIPIGANSPLVGTRPFRRAPHTGFFSATYSEKKITAAFTSAFASRSDDSTFLLDANYGNSLLLPNRNLDHGYAKVDLGGSYEWLSWLGFFLQGENLLSEQHIAPIGYPSLPMTVRLGLKIQWGPGSGK